MRGGEEAQIGERRPGALGSFLHTLRLCPSSALRPNCSPFRLLYRAKALDNEPPVNQKRLKREARAAGPKQH